MPDMSRCAALARQAAAQIGEHPAVADAFVIDETGLWRGIYLYVYYRSLDLAGLDLDAVEARITAACGVPGVLFAIGAHHDQFFGACFKWEAL